jgi:hypothetical protein
VNSLAEVGFSDFLHLGKNHGRYFFRGELASLAIEDDFNVRLVVLRDDLVWNQLLIGLNRLVAVLTTNKTLDIKYGIFRVDGSLVLGRVTNKSLAFLGPGNIGWCDTVTLVVGDDFDLSVLENTNTRVSST